MVTLFLILALIGIVDFLCYVFSLTIQSINNSWNSQIRTVAPWHTPELFCTGLFKQFNSFPSHFSGNFTNTLLNTSLVAAVVTLHIAFCSLHEFHLLPCCNRSEKNFCLQPHNSFFFFHFVAYHSTCTKERQDRIELWEFEITFNLQVWKLCFQVLLLFLCGSAEDFHES